MSSEEKGGINISKDVTRHRIVPFLERNTCEDFVKTGECKGVSSYFTNEEKKQKRDCRYVCLAKCKPEELVPMLTLPKFAIVKYSDGIEEKTKISKIDIHIICGAFNSIMAHIYPYSISIGISRHLYREIPDEYRVNSDAGMSIIYQEYTNPLEAGQLLCNYLRFLLRFTCQQTKRPEFQADLWLKTKPGIRQPVSIRFDKLYIRPDRFWNKIERFDMEHIRAELIFDIDKPTGLSDWEYVFGS